MTNRSLAATLFGVGGVWMIAENLAGFAFALDLFVRAPESTTLSPVGLASMVFGPVLVGLALLLGRERLAARLFTDEAVEAPSSATLLDVGFRVAGIVMIGRGVESLAWHFATWDALKEAGGDWGRAVQGTAILIFGLAVMLGARRLAALLSRAKTAGLSPSSS